MRKKLPLSEIKEWKSNPRTITAKRFAKLKENIQDDPELMEENPIFVRKDTMTIYSGHMRMKAVAELGWKEVMCEVSDVDEIRANKRAIILNAHAGDWNHDELATLLDEMEKQGTDISTLGLDEQINKIIEQLNEKEIIEDEVPEPPKEPKSKLGDLYILGDHRVLCGDSTKVEDIEKLMGGGLADCVVTDPPYNTGMTEKSQSEPNKRLGQKNGSTRLSHMFNDSYTEDEWTEFLTAVFSNYYAFTKGEAAFYVFIDWRRVGDIRKHMEAVMKVSNVIVWDKMVHGLGSDYKYTYELIVVGKKGNPTIQNRYEQEYQDVWHVQRKVGRNEDHATAKPVELCAKPIKHASKKDDIVLDLFGGSFSTMIAAHQLGRRFYGMEIDPRYVDVGIRRLLKLDPSLVMECNGKKIDTKEWMEQVA